MDKSTPQISSAEWQVMKVLWQNPGLTAAQVHAEISKENRWSDGTTRTYLRRLVEKGVLRFEQDPSDSRIYYYTPVIGEQEAMEMESRTFLNRIVKGRAGVVLASLIKSSSLTEEDLSELEEILQQRRRKDT